jgi:alpha-amylase/alpha-mannosidase (GH57 family)
MKEAKQLKLVLLWHMHQPDFRDQNSGEFRHPWVYLHALKDYSDMAAHLEEHPKVKAVFNLVPVLLDQLDDYTQQFTTGHVRDPLLRLLTRENPETLSVQERELILDQCFRANHTKMIEPYPAYKRLRDLYRFVREQEVDASRYLSGQYYADLLTWYHLSWTGETVRRAHEPIVRLMSQGEGYTHAERQEVFQAVGSVTKAVVGRYRKLAASGQVELSSTPHYHPIGPLLLDFACAREAMPDAPLPEAECYPGGRMRTGWHVDSALQSHQRRFGSAPTGMWPAEGAVSPAFCRLLAEHGVGWTATGEGVLANSLKKSGLPLDNRMAYLYRPYRVESSHRAITCFFRDDRLSDLIGFEYKDWHGADAANHFIAQLEEIRAATPDGDTPVVSVILDGENAWEYYPYNAYYFLRDLYRALESHPFIQTTTYAELLADPASKALHRPLSELVTGSWVYGNLSTWIGSTDKNRAWDLLCMAKQSYDLVMGSGRLSQEEMEAASIQLAVCEGSDWCWWFGDYNPRESVEKFDILYRANLGSLYRLLKLPPPAQLGEPVSRGAATTNTTGAMRRAA